MTGNGEDRPGGRRRPGQLEDQVLATLWAAEGRAMTPAQVQAELGELGDRLAYTTVMSTLTRMHRKGLVSRVPAGRGYAYAPLVDEADYTARAMTELLAHRHDRVGVLARFLSRLDPDDERVLQQLLRETEDP